MGGDTAFGASQRMDNHQVRAALVETVIGENQTRTLAPLFAAKNRITASVPNFATKRSETGGLIRRRRSIHP